MSFVCSVYGAEEGFEFEIKSVEHIDLLCRKDKTKNIEVFVSEQDLEMSIKDFMDNLLISEDCSELIGRYLRILLVKKTKYEVCLMEFSHVDEQMSYLYEHYLQQGNIETVKLYYTSYPPQLPRLFIPALVAYFVWVSFFGT